MWVSRHHVILRNTANNMICRNRTYLPPQSHGYVDHNKVGTYITKKRFYLNN